jgi:hypothetical protein
MLLTVLKVAPYLNLNLPTLKSSTILFSNTQEQYIILVIYCITNAADRSEVCCYIRDFSNLPTFKYFNHFVAKFSAALVVQFVVVTGFYY